MTTRTPVTPGGASSDDDDDDDDDDAGVGSSTGSSRNSRSFRIQFHALVDGADFACGQSYSGVGSGAATVTPVDLRLFIQDVKLLRADGTTQAMELELREPWQAPSVALLDFENGTGECGSAGTPELNTVLTGTAPDESYVGIQFSTAVPDSLNHVDPIKASEPLHSYPASAWDRVGGYPFSRIALMEVVTPNTTFGKAALTLGSAGCTQNSTSAGVTCTKPNRNLIELQDFDPDLDVIALDVAPIFADTDVSMGAVCDGSEAVCESMCAAIGVDCETGAAATRQDVFSVQ